MFNKGIIKKRVMEAVNAKITAAQTRLDEGVIEIDRQAEAKKEQLVNELVAEIVG